MNDFEKLRMNIDRQNTLQTLNALELWIRFGMLYDEIRRKYLLND